MSACPLVWCQFFMLVCNCRQIVLKSGPCFGVDPCVYDVEDHVNVIYYDNPLFNRMTDQVYIQIDYTCRTQKRAIKLTKDMRI